MQLIKWVVTWIALGLSAVSFAQETLTPEQLEQQKWATELWASMDKLTGNIQITQAKAVFTVPEDFYFLSAKDANIVLTEVWGNPPGNDVLGMLFPIQYTPFDGNAWGVTVEYEEDGYVSDEDAGDIDYSELLSNLQDDTRAANEHRVKEGYDAMHLVGWAADPYYHQASHKLYWAKEYQVEGYAENTLNYNIRVLGRKGVLVLNFIAAIPQLPEIESNLDQVLAMAEFEQGSAYDDFNPDIDEVAAYGIGALVAGKVIAKTGFLAVALVFLKKFGIFILIGLGALVQRLFKKKKEAAE